MEQTLNKLKLMLVEKKFISLEISDFINDVVCIFATDIPVSVPVINSELEDLGWGINPMDHGMYDLFTSLTAFESFQQRGSNP